MIATATDTSNVIRSFLADNQQRLITVTGTSAKVYALLAQYSPESTCMFAALSKLYDLTTTIFKGKQVQLSVKFGALRDHKGVFIGFDARPGGGTDG